MSALVRVFTPEHDHRLEGLIVCRDHLPKVAAEGDPPFMAEHFTVERAAFWGHRCLMCGVAAVPDRLCGNTDCRRPCIPSGPRSTAAMSARWRTRD